MTLSVEISGGTFVRALTDITYALAFAEQAEARIQRVLELLWEVLEYEHCALLIDAMPRGPLFTTIPVSHPDAERLRVRLSRLFETVSDRPIQWNGTEPYRLPEKLSAGSWSLAVPLVTVDAIVGILHVGRNTEEFTIHELRLLTIVASQLAGYSRGVQFLEQAERARTRAEQANRAKDRFLATLSHELRTPLNVVQGWLQILRGGAASGAAIQKAITIIDRNVLMQVQLVEQLLDAARIATSKLHIDVQLVEILPVINAAVDSMRPRAQKKGVELDYVVPSPRPWVIAGDPVRLEQAFANLLVNAVKFTPPGGHVRVSAAEDGSHVEVEFRDTGIGVDAEQLPKLFEPLWQADRALPPAAESGLGLGLFIVRHIVQLHGGEVRAESDGPNRGTAVRVRLPLQRSTRHETL